jgi:arsenate reductase (thioredoxin)
MSTVLFVCKQNAGRSQMSQALFQRAADSRHHALSAGTTPAQHVHPHVVTVMNELGINLAGRTPRQLSSELAQRADVVVTMGCGDECPYIPGKRYIDWDLTDPAGQPLDSVRAIRDEISQRVQALVDQLDALVTDRQRWNRQVGDRSDRKGVQGRADGRPLAQWHPAEHDHEAGDDRPGTDRQPECAG